MTEQVKVIKGLEICSHIGWCVGDNDCPYWRNDLKGKEQFDLCKSMLSDVLALLKEKDTEIRQLRLALDIAKGTCKGIVAEGR